MRQVSSSNMCYTRFSIRKMTTTKWQPREFIITTLNPNSTALKAGLFPSFWFVGVQADRLLLIGDE
jgi:hypothetical protein